MDTADIDEGIARRSHALRIHLIAFAGVSLVLFAIDLSFSEVRWFYWPVMVWGTVLGVHALYCKTLSVDDDWVERRTNKIRDKSYDIGHIHDIETSFNESQSKENSATERKC